MRARNVLVVALVGCCFGCLRRSDLNADCAWRADGVRPLDLTSATDLRHLTYDAQLGEELAIRYGDSFRGRKSLEELAVERAGCTERLFGHIESIHLVTRGDVLSARDRRNTWVDVIAVFVPTAVLFAILCDFVAVRVFRRFSPEERWAGITTLLVLSVIGSVLLLQIGTMWSWLVENVRLGDSHLSDRAFRLPWVRHPLVVLGSGVAVFWLMTTRRWSSRG